MRRMLMLTLMLGFVRQKYYIETDFYILFSSAVKPAGLVRKDQRGLLFTIL